jgi:anti-anti-sigma factor
MMEPRPAEDKVWVAVQPPWAFVRVSGRATFKVGTELKQFGTAAVEGGCRTLLFDMTDCTGMDSTFMGVLAGIALRLRKQEGEMVLLNLNTRTRGLVATLGLDHVVGAYEVGHTPLRLKELAEASQRMTTLAGAPENKQVTARTMLEAHEQLVALDPANQPRFKDVLTFLRDDLKQTRGKGG